MTPRILEGSYARLLGIKESIPFERAYINLSFATDFNFNLKILRDSTNDDFIGFDLSNDTFKRRGINVDDVVKSVFILKLNQLIRYLEMVHSASTKIVEVGSIYNSIRDAELKSRCGDLLSAADHFDRVINQATQILEDRVRKKVPSIGDMTGLPLVGKAINPEPSKSMIVFSSNPSEQEGYANLFKGLMGTFRNPSHHKFLETVTREQALQICAFIDNMLAALAVADVKQETS